MVRVQPRRAVPKRLRRLGCATVFNYYMVLVERRHPDAGELSRAWWWRITSIAWPWARTRLGFPGITVSFPTP